MWWMAAAALTGGLLSQDSQRKASRAQEKSLEASARDKLKAANTLLYASAINRTSGLIEAQKTKSEQVSAFASAGVDITSGSVSDTLRATESTMLRNDFLAKMNAEAQADSIKAGAGMLQAQASQVAQNQRDSVLPNLINTGLSAYNAYNSGGN